ncbi:MAG: hypothetical protein Q4B65_02665 [Candidatus Saccharibacteria bacterium]|nr:hypothetical protein [Candidatus Saccharibacteria bacterium]
MRKGLVKFKEGAASFYIVAFSTLILVIIAASFAMVIISEVTRAGNDELSQSAYDSALAGVEDAKLAYSNYQRCLEEGITLNPTYNPAATAGDPITCQDILYWMEYPDCDMVGHILGRIPKDSATDSDATNDEVLISDTVETAGDGATSNLNQAYTCVEIHTRLSDYKSTLTAADQAKVIKAQFNDASANEIETVKISWYSNTGDEVYNFSNFTVSVDPGHPAVRFKPATSVRVSTPPTIEVQMIQTNDTFSLSDFDQASGNRTNRATMYFVPTSSASDASSDGGNYVGIWNGSRNSLDAQRIANTNNINVTNEPFAVFCKDGGDQFACSVELELPGPKNVGDRNDDTFAFVISLPYGQPETDFSLEFFKSGGEKVELGSSQILIDSTGRANDLYRRVETRLESVDTSFAYPYYALQLMGEGNTLNKNMTVTCEGTFYDGWGSNC